MNTYLPLLQEKTEPLLSYVPDVSNMSTYLPILQDRAEPLLSYVPDSFNAWTAAGLAVVLAILYPLSVSFYNLFFSPIARFPGPKLAAATGYYEFYYDFFKKGSYVFEIEKMHNKYGPIVRINPHELSIRDPEFYNQLYVAGSVRRTNNYSHFARGIDFDGSHFLTTPHDLHRRRRKPIEPFFSKLGVTRLEPMLHEVTTKLNNRFESLKGTGTVVRLDHAFVAYSGDVISRICCENHIDMLEDADFAPHWFNLLHGIIFAIPLMMGFPVLIDIASFIPPSLLAMIDSGSQTILSFKKMAESHIVKAKQDKANGIVKDEKAKASLFHYIVNSDMPESELSTERLSKEAQVLLGAGSASTARTIDFMVYYVMSRPHIRARLQEELKDVMAGYPDKWPTTADLEKLPYLQAIIKEGYRLSYGVMHRLPRCSPDVAIQYKEWSIPKGVPVGMSAYMMHTDPEVYPKPFEFLPERWLNNEVDSALLKRNLVPFSRGSRSCLGMNLASAEINLVLATLFRPNAPTLELFETDDSDAIQAHDFMLPIPKLDTKGVRIVIK